MFVFDETLMNAGEAFRIYLIFNINVLKDAVLLRLENKGKNLSYDNNTVARMESHLHGHIHSAVALLYFDCLFNRPRWIRQCNPETFPRSSVIPEVSLKTHLLLSVVSRRSRYNYLKVPLYLLGGWSLYLHTSKKQKLWLCSLFVQPPLCNWRPAKKEQK